MTSDEEIERRVEDADSAKTRRRTTAAKHVGELARQRAAVAEQLREIDTKLGDVLAAASDVIGIDELAQFTDVPVADLTRWRDGTKPARTKRTRSTGGVTAAKSVVSTGPPTARPPSARQAQAAAESTGQATRPVENPGQVSAKAP